MKTRFFITCLASIFSFTAFSQSAVISDVAQKLNDFYQFYPIEKIQFSTDKDVYKPEEIVWFSLSITNENGQQVNPLSKEFEVSLYAESGIRIAKDLFKTAPGIIKGDLMLPKGLKEGKYVLVVATSLMSNANEAFYKLIYVNPKDEDAIRLKETKVPEYLKPGKTHQFSFTVEAMDGKPLKNEKLSYELKYKDEVVLDDKIKTDDSGAATFNLQLPNKAFDQPLTLAISNNKKELSYTKILPVKNEKITVHFYPEGGHLIAGIPQKIGFSANDQLGAPVAISGEILDEARTKITQLNTMYPGHGIFPILLEKGKNYTLKLSGGLGEGQQFKLPAATEGFAFSVSGTDKDFIYANLIPEKKEAQTIYVLGSKGPSVFWATETSLSGPTRLKIPRYGFPEGISLLSAFNSDGQLLGSRLVYLDKTPELKMLVSAPEKVKAGEVFKFVVETSNQPQETPLKMNMSISAASENMGWPLNWNSWILVNSDLQNTINNAEKILSSPNVESTLNYLMISNTFKNFDWNRILHFNAEQEQNKYREHGVSGRVLDKNEQIVPKAKISLMNSQNMQIINASANDNGNFYLPGIDPAKLNNFAVKTIDSEGKSDLHVEFEKTLSDQISNRVVSFIKEQKALQQMQYSSEFYQQNKSLFTKVKRKGEKSGEEREPTYKKYLESATSLLDVIKIIKPYRMDGDLIIFPGGTNSFIAQDGALIVIDGQKMGTSASALSSISPHDVESINVSTNPIDIQRYTGLNSVGLIEIETKKGEMAQPIEKSSEKITENGYRVPRDFWVKKSENKDQQPTTLLWNQAVSINGSGHWEFEVSTNKVIGKFLLRAKTIAPDGSPIQVEKTIEVIP